MSCNRCLTSPVAPNSGGSVPLFDSARQPLLEGGDKNPPLFRFISKPSTALISMAGMGSAGSRDRLPHRRNARRSRLAH
jgi:hypothetical protein